MKIASIIFSICSLVFLFNSCYNCRNDDCPLFSVDICFDLVDDTEGSLIFDNEVYELDSIITKSNLLNSAGFINTFRESTQSRDCIVLMTDTTTRYFIALSNNDIDTIDLTYQTTFSECCKNNIIEKVEDFDLVYNSKPICTNCINNPIIKVVK